MDGVRSRSRRSVQVEGHSISVGTTPQACTSATTSLIAGFGSGRSTSVIPDVPKVRSVTTIAFIIRLPAAVGQSERAARSGRPVDRFERQELRAEARRAGLLP